VVRTRDLDQLEARLIGHVDQVEARLDGRINRLDGRIDRLEAHMEHRFALVDERFNRVDERFNTMEARFDASLQRTLRTETIRFLGATAAIVTIVATVQGIVLSLVGG
jgi:flagellar capping protein FliD